VTLVRAAECVTNEMLVSTGRETECGLDVYRATNGAHKQLCEVQCLNMYRFLQYTIWLKIYNVLCYCYLRPNIMYLWSMPIQNAVSLAAAVY
jgi:hypothetical protein